VKKRLILAAIIALLAGGFFLLGLDDYVTLQGLERGVARFRHLEEQAPWQVGAGFFAAYVLMAALSLPGAAVMTLAAGALFGLVEGVLLASFASSIGATLAFLASRYLFRDLIQSRFGDRLKAINAGMERDGVFYLLTLRLVAVIPFFLVNLLMGLTTIRAPTFYWVSQLGMLAGTVVYVNAGTQLATIGSLGEVLSARVILAFALLGVFPLIARLLARRLRRLRVYARWNRPRRFDRNLVVIGAGAAGLVTSYVAATVRASVTLIEAGRMGGDCLNYGCVPSKALIASARVAHQVARAGEYGVVTGPAHVDFAAVMRRVHDVIARVAPHDSEERYTSLGVEVLKGRATLVDPWTVEVALADGGVRRLTTRSVVLATGSRPFVPPVPGIEDVGYVTSDTLWNEFAALDAAPERLLVLGGGPIGCELAQAFARLGSRVTLLEKAPRLLNREDADVAAEAHAVLAEEGVEVLAGHEAVRFGREGERKFAVAAGDEGERHIEFDALICAVGRAANLSGYGLEELGIPAERTVQTNEYLETLYPNILAAGDVAGPFQLTHAASHQAWYAAVNALFGHFKRFKPGYAALPRVTFLDPEIAHVGLNELEAREQGVPCEVTRYDLADLDRAIAESRTRGFVKVLTVPGKDRILGATVVGEHAGELLAEFTLAVNHGLGLGKILGTIHAYPTLAEGNKYAAGQWRKAHAPERLLGWVEKYHASRRA
jgi:pyruvate/2-oxoglutarate dehydrogenase complex dihydrolipoamide dehydrogenase (E3) component/uncharacterized membrane protein YdjX (TVP38/TMEM64 family)